MTSSPALGVWDQGEHPVLFARDEMDDLELEESAL